MSLEDMSDLVPFSNLLGVRYTSSDPSRVEATMAATTEVSTMIGTLHGGAIMGLADSVGAACAFVDLPAGSVTLTVQSNTNFLRAVKTGSVVRAESSPMHVGRTTMVVQTDVFDDQDRCVARTTQTQTVSPGA